MIKNLPYELRDLEIHMQKLLVRMNAVEAQLKGGSVSPEEFAQLKAEVDSLKESMVPTGAITLWSAMNAPNGYLICDGAEVSRTTYSRLFSVVGDTFGAGDGTTTFNVPNFQGVVPRGAGTQDINGRIKDGGALGSVLEDQMQRVTGSTQQVNQRNSATSSGMINITSVNNIAGSGTTSGERNLYNWTIDTANSPNARTSSTTDGETRVSSLSINYIIKY